MSGKGSTFGSGSDAVTAREAERCPARFRVVTVTVVGRPGVSFRSRIGMTCRALGLTNGMHQRGKGWPSTSML